MKCVICLLKINGPDMFTHDCKNLFHLSCIITWLKSGSDKHCPFCRVQLIEPNIQELYKLIQPEEIITNIDNLNDLLKLTGVRQIAPNVIVFNLMYDDWVKKFKQFIIINKIASYQLNSIKLANINYKILFDIYNVQYTITCNKLGQYQTEYAYRIMLEEPLISNINNFNSIIADLTGKSVTTIKVHDKMCIILKHVKDTSIAYSNAGLIQENKTINDMAINNKGNFIFELSLHKYGDSSSNIKICDDLMELVMLSSFNNDDFEKEQHIKMQEYISCDHISLNALKVMYFTHKSVQSHDEFKLFDKYLLESDSDKD